MNKKISYSTEGRNLRPNLRMRTNCCLSEETSSLQGGFFLSRELADPSVLQDGDRHILIDVLDQAFTDQYGVPSF